MDEEYRHSALVMKDLRVIADSYVIDNDGTDLSIIIGKQESANRLQNYGWVDEIKKNGSIDYATFICTFTDVGVKVREEFIENRDRVGYAGCDVTPDEFLVEIGVVE